MQTHQPSSANPAQRVSPIPDTTVPVVTRRTSSPPAKRRRTSSPPHVSPSPSPPRSPSPEAQPSPSPTPTPATAKWFRKPSVVWYRGHDLRVEDHPALLAAAQRGGPVIPLFVWDPCDRFGADLGHVKKWWLRQSLFCLQRDLQRLGVQLYTRIGLSTDELRKFLNETGADAVFWNRCYEPELLSRDEELRDELTSEGLTAESFKAELLVEPWELKNDDVSPCFETFHAYMRAWMTVPPPPEPLPCPSRLQPITQNVKNMGIDALGFEIPDRVNETLSKIWAPGSAQAKAQLDRFLREVFPAFGEGRCRRHFEGTSRLSPHIRFGELSPRRMYYSTRLRVSRWDQGSMYAVVSPSRNDSSVRPNSVALNEKRKATPDVLHHTPPNGTATKKARHGREAAAASPPRQKSEPRGGKKNDLKVGAHHQTQLPQTTPQRLIRPQRNVTRIVRRSAVPHISLSARAFLKNLCLRDFSYHVLFHNPEFDTRPLIPEFSSFPWAQDRGSLKAWQMARTGYPIVDAAMRELRETGWIHNSMRFLLACFLTKYLLLPWSLGLKEFYGLLVDGDHSSNALGWQWTAGSNTDAFPVSCLVNPVKVAARHDPTGSYVRRWLPELAKLPTKYVHEPWKAPPELLESAGINLGVTYPKRIVLMQEARDRAFESMRVMKRIFAGSRVLRGIYDVKEEERVKEWPEEGPEELLVDESATMTGKMNLLPSLWALLQGDQNSNYLSSSSSGSDPLIAMGTASLAEGALAVPMDDQHESIEHALITAHTQGPPPEALSIAAEAVTAGDRALGEPMYTHDKNCETQGMMAENSSGSALAFDHLGETLKYNGTDMGPFAEPEKPRARQDAMDPDTARGRPEPTRFTAGIREAMHSGPLLANGNSFQGSGAQTLAPYVHQPQQQIQQFQQIQQLQQYQLPQHLQIHQQQQRQQSRQTQPQHPEQQQQHQKQHQQQNRSQHSIPAQHLRRPHPSHPRPQSTQVMDGIYGHASHTGGLPTTSLAGVPMTGASVMMGPANGNQELGVNPMFTGTEPGNSMYTHPLSMGQFYGFPQVVSVVNATHPLNGSERSDGLGSSTGPGMQKLAVQGMMAVPYGMYGGNVFDPSVLGNAFQSGGAPYAPSATSSQPQMHGGHQPQYGFPTHPVYFTPPTSDVPHVQGTAHLPHQSHPDISPSVRESGISVTAQARNSTSAAAAAAVAAGEAEVTRNAIAEGQSPITNAPHIQGGIQSGTNSAVTGPSTSKQRAVPPDLPPSNTATVKAAQGRSSAKSSTRSRTPARRRAPGAGVTGRNRGDSKNSSGVKGRGGGSKGSGSQPKGRTENTQPQGTTLKARQEMLASVLSKEDHEYHGFAKYLAATYELTASTDRHTSKDYVRLCNLKDDYHKQSDSDKDKLKIYRIKAFFSQILKLEVTGEWDRHNHGGVRGPYVYGIRPLKTDATPHLTQN